jgi:hypothetical protein
MGVLVRYEDILNMYKSREAGEKALKKIENILPIYSTERLSGIIGDIFGDGHLQGPEKWRADFTSNSMLELKRFGKEVNLLFGYKGKIRRCTTNKYGVTYNFGLNNKPIGRILFLCGAPIGNKVLNSTKIPPWILDDKIFFTRFIQRLFDCEGCVDTYSKCIEINMSKSENLINNGFDFFNQIKNHLSKYYGINSTNPFTINRINKRKDSIITKEIKFRIKGKTSLELFKKCINFENRVKQQKLILILKC